MATVNKYNEIENMYELLIFQGYKNLVFYWDFASSYVNTKDKLDELVK